MTDHTRSRWWVRATRGAIAGYAATWVMDLVTTGLMKEQSEADQRREAEARPNGKSTVGNLLDRIEGATGADLDEPGRSTASQAIHYGLGVVPGAIYGILRPRVPLLGAMHGLLYGALLWALNDEYANTELGLAGPFEAYPASSHWRGFVGHAVLGLVTDTGMDVLGG